MSTGVDVNLGRKKLDWARNHMPIHARLRQIYGEKKPFQGLTIAVCSHLEAKTGVLIETLAAAGAHVVFTGSEPMSTQDDVVAALNEQPNITGYAKRGVSECTPSGPSWPSTSSGCASKPQRASTA